MDIEFGRLEVLMAGQDRQPACRAVFHQHVRKNRATRFIESGKRLIQNPNGSAGGQQTRLDVGGLDPQIVPVVGGGVLLVGDNDAA